MIETLALLPEVPGLLAHFALRHGGVSDGPHDSLNLGLSTGDDPARVVENRRRLASHVGVPLERWLVAGQVHGARVLTASEELVGVGTVTLCPDEHSADAVFLPTPGLFALALSADCPLVVLADPKRGFAGVAHAGWRGTAAGVIEALVERFETEGSMASELLSAVSPGICGHCYEVGEEVFEALRGKPGLDVARVGARNLDLRVVHREILATAGINATLASECSRCSAGFFSHRRDRGRTGRCGAIVGFLS